METIQKNQIKILELKKTVCVCVCVCVCVLREIERKQMLQC